MRRIIAPMLMAGTLLSGCAAPDLGPRPAMTAPSQLKSSASLASPLTASAWPKEDWWKRYDDPQLNAMVDEALAGSPDVAAAMARVRQARGLMESAGAAVLPSVGGSGEAGAKKQSYNNGIPAMFVPHGWKSYGMVALNASFDLDLWGKNKANLAAATSAYDASVVDAHQARLILTSSIVSAYTQLAQLYADQDVLQKTIDARQSSVKLTGDRVQAGLDNDMPLAQARARVAQARFQLEQNEEAIAKQRHALAALMGKGPDRGLQITRPDPKWLQPTVLPSDAGIALAGRRPDIVAARLQVEANGHKIDAARAAFMPDISLSGLLGFQSLGLANLFKIDSYTGQASAAVSLPIFEGGQLRGNFRQTRGKYDEAVANYNKTVINALKDVADVVASRQSTEKQIASADQALTEAQRAYDLIRTRYRSGLVTYLDVLSAEDTLLASEQNATDIRFRRVALDVALVRALGGGFSEQDLKDQQS